MKLHADIPTDIKSLIIEDAHTLCKAFDPNSNCNAYLLEKLSAANTTAHYFENNDGKITGMAILEIIDQRYGNLIVHTIEDKDEACFAHLLTTKKIIDKNILELIQFRSNFHYRDEFLRLGLREKERVRMSHTHIQTFNDIDAMPDVSFQELTLNDNDVCGTISFKAHKHRINIECYDAYGSEQKRAMFANDLRNRKHGKPIKEASLLMRYKETPIGLIEVIHTNQGELTMGWIMDVALLPEYQGMGLGKHLIKHSMKQLVKAGYTAAGLAVTLSNKNAHQLYESLGFTDYEFFVEIIGE
jgi:GNAT superfamily N-acetyltransferase